MKIFLDMIERILWINANKSLEALLMNTHDLHFHGEIRKIHILTENVSYFSMKTFVVGTH